MNWHAARFGVTVATAVAVTACGQLIRSDITTFHKLPQVAEIQSFIVLPMDDNQRNSLEFQSYADLVSKYLSEYGYKSAQLDVESPDLVIFIGYSIDQGNTVSGSTPIFGQTGGGTSYQRGTISGFSSGTLTYSGRTYTPPTYGVVGSIPYSRTRYTRFFILEIYDGRKVVLGEGEKLYESRVVSSGTSGSLNEVIPTMIYGLFEDFPGNSGETRRDISLKH